MAENRAGGQDLNARRLQCKGGFTATDPHGIERNKKRRLPEETAFSYS
jgi:hypothetical protein